MSSGFKQAEFKSNIFKLFLKINKNTFIIYHIKNQIVNSIILMTNNNIFNTEINQSGNWLMSNITKVFMYYISL